MRRIALTVVALFAHLFVSQPGIVPAAPFGSHVVYVPLVAHQYPPRHGVGMGWAECGDWAILRPAWYYNWGYESACPDAVGVEYVDMIWGAGNMNDLIGTPWLLGFNEPNLCGQANITPAQGAVLWRQVEAQHPDRRLVSPSPSQPVPDGWCQTWPNGYDWLWEMERVYELLYHGRPRFNALAVHYYAGVHEESLPQYLARIRDEALAHGHAVPIWLTEFGTCGDASWMDESVTWLRAQPWIARWAWYSARIPDPSWGCSALLDDDGLTAYGEHFVALREGQ